MRTNFPIVGQAEAEHYHGAGHNHCNKRVEVNVAPLDYALNPGSFRGRAAIVTLGCAKNQVDSEVMLGVLRNSGFEIVSDLDHADVAIVNTCGFLESAVRESVDAILDVAQRKKSAQLRRLIVAGCAVSRYGSELQKTLPEVDAFITTDQITSVAKAALGQSLDSWGPNNQFVEVLGQAARPYFLYDDSMPRLLSSRSHMAYVKVGEGCDRPCTFCIIPKIRGAMRSRTIESVVREVQMLGEQGVREVNLVAQDLTSYGRDHKQGDLSDLLMALDNARSMRWIRLLYAYPIGTDARLLQTIQSSNSVCKYLDLPLQHASERLLKLMKRPIGKFAPRQIAEFIKRTAPNIHLRTTFIVGFPGETDADLIELEQLIAAGHFGSVGIFTYSQEAGTPAGEMVEQIPEREKIARRDHLMAVQQKVVDRNLASRIGKREIVLIEGQHEETDLLLTGRTQYQAPEVDGVVIINDIATDLQDLGSDGQELNDLVRPGMMVEVEFSEAAGYDMIGTVVGIPDGEGVNTLGDAMS